MEKLILNVCGTELTTFMSKKDGEQLIALKPLCEALGIRFTQQLEKIKKNPQFQLHYLSSMVAQDGKNRTMACIPAREVGMWVCNINANRVNPEIKEKVLEFQKYLQEVIYQALFKGVTHEQFFLLQDKLNMTLDMVKDLTEKVSTLEKENEVFRRAQLSGYGKAMSHYGHMKKRRTTQGI